MSQLIDDRLVAGRGQTLIQGVVRCIAPNPGPMTGPGTNSYIVGTGPVVVVDPGVEDAAHLARLVELAGDDAAAVLLTHRHPDHADGARALADRLNVPLMAWPRPEPARHDAAVAIDADLVDGQTLELGAVTLEVLYTPGHAGDHVSLLVQPGGLLIAGDTVMADVTVVIIPPDGNMSAYLATLARLQALPLACIAPGHGRLLAHPARVLENIAAHRLAREAQVLAALAEAADSSAAQIATQLYPDLDPRLSDMAAAQVTAHLMRLAELGHVERASDTRWNTVR